MAATYNPWRGVSHLPAQVWVLFAANLINRVGNMARPFLVLYLTTRLGVAPTRAGLALTVFGVAAIFAGPLAGRLCDRLGALPVMWGALASSALFVALLPSISSFPGVLVCVAIWAFASEGFRPASLLLLTEATDTEYRRLTMSVNRLSLNLGTSMGPALGGVLAGISFIVLFRVDALTSLIGALLLFWWWLRHDHSPARVVPIHPAPQRQPLWRAGWRALYRPHFLQLVLGTILIVAVFMQIEGAWSMYLIRYLHYQPVFYGTMITVNCLLIATCEIPLVNATRHWSSRRLVMAACLCIGSGFGAMAFARTLPAIIATVVVWTVGEMLLFTLLPNLYEAQASPSTRGTYLGVYSAAGSAAYAVGAWLGLTILTHAGAGVLWCGCFLVSLLAAGILVGQRSVTSRANRRPNVLGAEA